MLGEISTTLRYANDTTLIAENEEELKNFLMGVKEESEKVSLKLKIKKKINRERKLISLHLLLYFMANRRGKVGSRGRFPLLEP